MNIVPFKAEHARALVDPYHCLMGDILPEEMEATSDAITGLVGGKVIFCAGRQKQWEGRYVVWAIMSKDSGKYMVAITRAVRRGIEVCEGRLEAIVRANFDMGHRWANMVGLKFHHREEMFLPDGSDADIYVRFC